MMALTGKTVKLTQDDLAIISAMAVVLIKQHYAPEGSEARRRIDALLEKL